MGKEVDFVGHNSARAQIDLSSKIDMPVKTCTQVHGDKIVVVTNSDQKIDEVQADAIITTLSNVIIGVKTADCVPILIAGSKTIAAIHAGRKGALLNISAKVINSLIEDFEENISDLKVLIGPHLRFENHLIFDNEANKFPPRYCDYSPIGEHAVNNKLIVSKYLEDNNLTNKSMNSWQSARFDFSAFVIDQLLACSLNPNQIQDCSIDSFDNQKFHSYRRDYPNHGLNFGYIW